MNDSYSSSPLIPIDVICQHNADGKLIPLRIRIPDDLGEYQTYTIHNYRSLDVDPGMPTEDGISLTVYDLVFECHICVFGVGRKVRLYYNLKSTDPVWRINKTYLTA